MKTFFESRNRPFLEVNEAQAYIPENAEVLFNERGTAPGMWIEDNGKILVSMPGVPHEMEFITTKHIIPRVKEKYHLPALYYAHIQTAEIGESFLAEQIEDIESSIPADISLAYLPSALSVNIRLSGKENQKEEIDSFADKIRERISKHVYGDSKTPIVDLVFQNLKERKETISLVESCTGGYLANGITNINGSSEVFIGGWNVYTNEFKSQELDVSNVDFSQFNSDFSTEGLSQEEIVNESQTLAAKETSGALGAIRALPRALQNINWLELILALGTIVIIYGFKRITTKVPSTLVALIVMSGIAVAFSLDYRTIQEIPSGIPQIKWEIFSGFSISSVTPYIFTALTLALLGAIDSLLTSVVADNMTKTKHKPNKELVGQGIGNSIAALFGGIPGAGATIRTVVNINAGGKTKLSGMIAGVMLLIIM